MIDCKNRVKLFYHGQWLRKKKNNDLITVDYVELSTKGGRLVYKVYDTWGNVHNAEDLY